MAQDRASCSDMWTREVIAETIQQVESTLIQWGWHVALTGSCLLRGESAHDLDVIVYPHNTQTFDRFAPALESLGWTRTHTAFEMRAHWKSGDRKHVECWRDDHDRRIDVIVFLK